MSVDYPVWTGSEWVEVAIPEMDGQPIVVPNVAAVVFSPDRTHVLLQRRDKPGEAVQGRLEVPGGRWQAGESAAQALRREVAEETGVEVLEVLDDGATHTFPGGPTVEATKPAAAVAGLDGAYPALLVAYVCVGEGSPRPLPGETAAPAWWRIADLTAHLESDPSDFVWQSAVILRTVLET